MVVEPSISVFDQISSNNSLQGEPYWHKVNTEYKSLEKVKCKTYKKIVSVKKTHKNVKIRCVPNYFNDSLQGTFTGTLSTQNVQR